MIKNISSYAFGVGALFFNYPINIFDDYSIRVTLNQTDAFNAIVRIEGIMVI